MDYEIAFLKALVLTISIETLVLFIVSKTIYKNEFIPIKLLILNGIIASMATLPYLWFIFPMLLLSRLWYSILSEITAIMVESFIIYGILKLSLKKSFIVSLICNSVSYLIGILIF